MIWLSWFGLRCVDFAVCRNAFFRVCLLVRWVWVALVVAAASVWRCIVTISCALGFVICCIMLFGGLLGVVCGECFGLSDGEFVWLWG